jgi:DNA-binding NarL/FixJ family response regulator
VALPNSIFIIDDSKEIRRALGRLLESMPGWEVCGEAANGREGIEKVHRLKPDVVVLDMSMPEMDGIAVAKILKATMPETPIVMFTNFAEDQFLKREVLSAGINQVVSKSDSRALLSAVKQVLGPDEPALVF